MAAKRAGVPLFLLDRSVDPRLAKVDEDYAAFIGSDVTLEGKIAVEWLVKATTIETTVERFASIFEQIMVLLRDTVLGA